MQIKTLKCMIYIKDLLNRIKWDRKEKPEEYTLLYHDRALDRLLEIKYTDIKSTEDNFIVLEMAGEKVNIPLHRIREVRRKGETVWKRLERKETA